MTISLDTLKEAVQIKESIAKLEARLNKILGGGGDAPFPFTPAKRGRPKKNASAKLSYDGNNPWAVSLENQPESKKGRRKMSRSARAKIAAAQRARWAKSKETSLAPVKPEKKRKVGISAEGRARLAAAMKARWAARKKGAPAPNAKKK